MANISNYKDWLSNWKILIKIKALKFKRKKEREREAQVDLFQVKRIPTSFLKRAFSYKLVTNKIDKSSTLSALQIISC